MLLLPRVSGVGAYKHPVPVIAASLRGGRDDASRHSRRSGTPTEHTHTSVNRNTVRGISWFRGPFSWQSLENLRKRPWMPGSNASRPLPNHNQDQSQRTAPFLPALQTAS